MMCVMGQLFVEFAIVPTQQFVHSLHAATKFCFQEIEIFFAAYYFQTLQSLDFSQQSDLPRVLIGNERGPCCHKRVPVKAAYFLLNLWHLYLHALF